MPEAKSAVFARQVRRMREHRGWSQTELAQRLASIGHPIGQSRVSTIEAPGPEPRTVSIDQAAAFATALGVPLELLLTDADVWVTPTVLADTVTLILTSLDGAAEDLVKDANAIRRRAATWLAENGIDAAERLYYLPDGTPLRPFLPLEITRKEA